MTRWLWAAAALALVLLAIQEISGQGRARIEGVVVASDGAVVAGASIDVRLEGRTVMTTTTGAEGQFRIDLAAGPKDVFEIRVSLPGFSVQTVEVGPSRRTGASTGSVTRNVKRDTALVG